MLYPYEKFIIYLFIWLFSLLGILLIITFFVVIRKKNFDTFLLMKNPFRFINKKKKKSKKLGENVNISDLFREKLGDKIVQYMIEVSQSDNLKLVKDRIKRIQEECERLNSLRLPEESKRIISIVLIWVKHFDIERHMSEMKIFRRDTQIIYDFKKHDFQLRISMD